MEIEDLLPVDTAVTETAPRRVFVLFVVVPTLLGAAHHVDHILRGNHIGWPLTPEVNAFTYSLTIYPVIAISLFLTVTERVGVRYWAGLFAFSAGILTYFHISPWAVEPPQDVIWPYANPAVGYAAFGILIALIGSAVVGSVYAALLWRREERATAGKREDPG